MISRLERRLTPGAVRAAFACEVVFGVPPRAMFPGLYEQVEEAVMTRAARLYEALENRTDKASVRKRELLGDMMRRATEGGLHV
jgi:hypothetical protein